MPRARLLSLLMLLLLSTGINAGEMLKTNTSWDGGDFHYPEGTPEVTSLLLILDEGQVTPWHCHPVPTFGYVLEGAIEVETRAGDHIVLRQGQSVVEVMKTLHRGRGLDGGGRVLVFYAGVSELANTVLVDDREQAELCRP